MAQPAVVGPLAERDLGDQLGLDPVRATRRSSARGGSGENGGVARSSGSSRARSSTQRGVR